MNFTVIIAGVFAEVGAAERIILETDFVFCCDGERFDPRTRFLEPHNGFFGDRVLAVLRCDVNDLLASAQGFLYNRIENTNGLPKAGRCLNEHRVPLLHPLVDCLHDLTLSRTRALERKRESTCNLLSTGDTLLGLCDLYDKLIET